MLAAGPLLAIVPLCIGHSERGARATFGALAAVAVFALLDAGLYYHAVAPALDDVYSFAGTGAVAASVGRSRSRCTRIGRPPTRCSTTPAAEHAGSDRGRRPRPCCPATLPWCCSPATAISMRFAGSPRRHPRSGGTDDGRASCCRTARHPALPAIRGARRSSPAVELAWWVQSAAARGIAHSRGGVGSAAPDGTTSA